MNLLNLHVLGQEPLLVVLLYGLSVAVALPACVEPIDEVIVDPSALDLLRGAAALFLVQHHDKLLPAGQPVPDGLHAPGFVLRPPGTCCHRLPPPCESGEIVVPGDLARGPTQLMTYELRPRPCLLPTQLDKRRRLHRWSRWVRSCF